MKLKILLTTLSITLLAACATDDADQTQVIAKSESPVRLEDRLRELDAAAAGKVTAGNVIPANQPAVIATPAPAEDESLVVRTDPVRPVRQSKPVSMQEKAIVAMTGQAAADSYKRMQNPRAAGQDFDIRRAREPLYRENYQHDQDQRVMRVASDPVSTFSIDVDTGSYTNTRRWLNQGQLPPQDAVRVEEFINYFDYDYPLPASMQTPFQVSTEIAPTPWNANTRLLRIGIQGYRVPKTQLPASNLVFLIDVSGSMSSPDKLPLLQQALTLLSRQLDARDSISMVVYAGASGVVLPPTRGDCRAAILTALQRLRAGGSTNGAAGIRLAYQLARQNYLQNGVNRVILATDGDFNVGLASTKELIDLIRRQRKAGIALTTLGFGSGNYNDHLLEQLADEGNGNHAYIDRLSEAQKVLGEELSSTLMTIAKDVKIQVEFNPSRVSEYRLIGYANRVLNEEDFNNDTVDAGEIGAGHRVTALYEITLADSPGQRLPARRYPTGTRLIAPDGASFGNELADLRIRYKLPGGTTSKLIESPILDSGINARGSTSFNFAAAVAAFGQRLRGGKYLGSFEYSDIADLAQVARANDPHGYRSEFMQLVRLADALDAPVNVTQRINADR